MGAIDPALWERIEAQSQATDHALINAGIAAVAPIAETSFEEWRRVLSVNLDGAFLSLRTALRLFPDGGSAVPRWMRSMRRTGTVTPLVYAGARTLLTSVDSRMN